MHILSFDLEEWFHLLDHHETRDEMQWERFPARIERNLDRLLNVLSEAGQPATFFCLGWVAEKYPHLVRNIADAGYEIACHSHLHQLAYEQTPAQFRSDLRRCLAAISDATGMAVSTYRAPGFSLVRESLWLLEVLADEGIQVDCSVFPAKRGHGGLPIFEALGPCLLRLPSGRSLKELPVNVHAVAGRRFVFSGGGYFRLLPYALLKRLFARHDYVMTYFHPRDFDPGQPAIPGLPVARRFKSYVGLGGAEQKLVRLLRDFRFVDSRTAVASLDWKAIPVVAI